MIHGEAIQMIREELGMTSKVFGCRLRQYHWKEIER